jgi:hypothetical protein
MGVTSVEYSVQHEKIEKLLNAVDRPGDYCVHGRLVVPVPRLEVVSAGLISFPVPAAHAGSLIRAAEQAPYGRGPQTLVDTSVRNCWQVDASKVQVGGAGWNTTFTSILDKAAEGLGCPPERLEARLYKLLVYEKGGFFKEHRDTEKVRGMVATLVVTLPAVGSGGELVVRHNNRETVIDMCASDPSVLTFAAFYADCSHETLALREGHRVALVYNLILRGKRAAALSRAPVFLDQVEAISAYLADWGRQTNTNDKIVWVLDHDYSGAGLSFDLLKGMDDAVARVLSEACRRAGCSLHAAILHIEESGSPVYGYSGPYDDYDFEFAELAEVYEDSCWLDSWTATERYSPSFGKIPLASEELLPAGALDHAEPDERVVHEASGNTGVSLEHTYLNAALVIWPKANTVSVLSSGGIDGAVEYVKAEIKSGEDGGGTNPASSELLLQLIDAWPSSTAYGRHDGQATRSKMLHLLSSVPDAAVTGRFLREIVRPKYTGGENDGLIAVARRHGPQAMSGFLPQLIEAKLVRCVSSLADLTWRLCKEFGQSDGQAWLEVLQAAARKMTQALPRVFEPPEETDRPWLQPKRETLDAQSIAGILRIGWYFGQDGELVAAARLLVEHPSVATPDRAIPSALSMLRTPGVEYSRKPAFWTLWSHAAEFLLARSASPPGPPRDWFVNIKMDCDCEACRPLQAFCRDRRAKTRTFAMRQSLRFHLETKIRDLDLPMDHKTVKQGSPHKLVCTKNRADHQRRLEEYAEDVAHMQKLLQAPPAFEAVSQSGRIIDRLRTAGSVGE